MYCIYPCVSCWTRIEASQDGAAASGLFECPGIATALGAHSNSGLQHAMSCVSALTLLADAVSK